MNTERQQFLTLLGRSHARLSSVEVSYLINCQPSDLSILIGARLLRPLGNPRKNAPKYFAAKRILELADDPAWLDKVTAKMQEYWQRHNHDKQNSSDEQSQESFALRPRKRLAAAA
jgi:hypothetical protein